MRPHTPASRPMTPAVMANGPMVVEPIGAGSR